MQEMGKPYKLSHFEWCDDFSVARNYNFSQAPESEWLFWLDSDDTIEGGEHLGELLNALTEDVGAVWFQYNYAQDEFNNIVTIFERERLLRARYGWVWRSRVHETVQPSTQCKYVRDGRIIIRHNHGGGSRSSRNFKLLNLMGQEEPDNKRTWLYLGHQHFAEGNWIKAAEWYLKFSSDPTVTPIEKYQTLTYAAKALRSLADARQAIQCDMAAMELYPEWADAYLGMGLNYLQLNDWDKVIYWCEQAKTKRPPDPLIFINPMDYSFNVPVTLAQAYVQKNQFMAALKEYEAAYRIRPIEDVKHNLMGLRDAVRRGKIVESIKTLAVSLLDDKELVKLKDLPKILPYWMSDLPEYHQIVGGVQHYTKDLKDAPEIVEDDGKVTICLDNVLEPEKLLGKYPDKMVTLVSNRPQQDKAQSRVLSMQDMEHLVAQDGRRILNLKHEGTKVTCQYDHVVADGLLVKMYIGQGLEHWNPQTIMDQGCGGSETAAAQVAMNLTRSKHRALVYAMDNQVWDGAIFRHHSLWKPQYPPADLVISSRQPDVFNQSVLANQKWLWVHDIHCGPVLTPEVAGQLDAIVCLSHWHAGFLKRTYPWLAECEELDLDWNTPSYEDNVTVGQFHADAKLVRKPILAIIGDGIDSKRFENLDLSQKKPHSFIWGSSPDRGLEQVLNLWPLIRQAWPDATIDIYYGWNYFDSSLGVSGQREFKARILELIKQEGVTWRGRIGQLQLAQEMARSQIWLYPPPHEFRETYCILAQELQAAGVVCFYRQNGALGETIGPLRGVPLTLDATPEQIVQRLVRVMSDPEEWQRLTIEGRRQALRQSWGEQTNKMLKLYGIIEGRKNG